MSLQSFLTKIWDQVKALFNGIPDGDIKSAFLHNLSILVAQVAADGKLSWGDGVYILEWYYQHEYKAA
jgi:hypothetical protein